MKSLDEIEEEAFAINQRMMDIFDELRETPEKAADLAEELAMLIHRAKVIHCSLRFYNETAAQLMKSDCHGPH
jgi:predicted metalloenzyme YecM